MAENLFLRLIIYDKELYLCLSIATVYKFPQSALRQRLPDRCRGARPTGKVYVMTLWYDSA
jgi:hypothetical protein